MCKTKPERIPWKEGGREKKKTGDTEKKQSDNLQMNEIGESE